jgi:hypothetical protein
MSGTTIFVYSVIHGTTRWVFPVAAGPVAYLDRRWHGFSRYWKKRMQELIQQIIDKTGIPADKAQQVLGVVAGFVKNKFPAMGGQIDSLLGTGGGTAAPADKSGDDEAGLLGGITGKFGL